jgi:hypothetical protein
MAYEDVIPGEWFPVPGKKLILACCDCGLVHIVDFKFKDGKLFMRMDRDEGRTKRLRKKITNIKIKENGRQN